MRRLKKHSMAISFFTESAVHGDIRVPSPTALWR